MAKFFKNFTDEKKIYMQIVLFALTLHVLYVIIYTALSMPVLTTYNIFSVLFYTALIFVVSKEHYKLGVVAVHAEVSVFVLVTALCGGAGTGIGMYLLSMASLVYFCPFEHKSVPYLLAIGDTIVYIILRICVDTFIPYPYPLTGAASTFMHVFNACGSFLVILSAAFFTDTSAMFTKKKLTQENRALASLANYDHLTGLQSRHLFKNSVQRPYMTFDEMTIAIGDIDNFKVINDTYGHICGDYVLQTIADIMRKSFDPGKVDICRWGGEEFVFLFHGFSLSDSYTLIEELRKKIEQYEFTYEDKKFHATMTFGLVCDSCGKFSIDMLDVADQLLYEGKQHGKNVVIRKIIKQ